MKTTHVRRAAIISTVLVLAALSGCASVAVSNDAIEQNTASALGIPKGSFTISDRVNDGIKSTYTVKTNSGKKYSCYVTGTVTVVGREVSDAMCNEAGKPAKQTTGTASQSCNALLKAAGKCS
jgi:hypothetical protein